ncbi:fimbrillin family protein [Porphyromonadaceae bacterium W3.11]|nr:fimbrillin family protein [Porphyromonadaceae bacterium W3.11]
MKNVTKFSSILLLTLMVFMASCCRQDAQDLVSPFDKREGNVSLDGAIADLKTRAVDNKWQANDQIGVYPYTGDVLSNDNLIDNGGRKGNRKYVTTDGDGNFTSVIEGVWLENQTANLIAYYPYNANQGTSLEYKFDASNQSNHALIDLLYSDNVKGVTSSKNNATMVFDHSLTLVVFNVKSEAIGIDGKDLSLTDALVDGSMNLIDGKVVTGTTKKTLTQKLNKVDEVNQASFILPPQNLAKVKVNVNGVGKEAKPIELETVQGHKHVIDILINSEGQLVIGNAKINDWLDGKSPDGPIILDPEDNNPIDPNPDPTPGDPTKLIINAPFDTELAPFAAQSVKGDQSWNVNTKYKNAYISGYDNATKKSYENEDWLISPAMDLSDTKAGYIHFMHTWNMGDVSLMKDQLTVWFSTDYTDDATKATWTQVTIPNYPTGKDWNNVESGNIKFPASVFGESNVRFALKYTCTDAASGTWQVKELKTFVDKGSLVGGNTPTPDPDPDPDPTPDPTPGDNQLLFPGSNFEDFAAFKASLNQYGLNFAEESAAGEGRDNSKALKLATTIGDKNSYVFTTLVQDGYSLEGKSKIVFYVKGKASKSLTCNVYTTKVEKPKMGIDYKCFNLGDLSGSDAMLQPTEKNDYIGTIDTNGEWRKVTLDISGLVPNKDAGDTLFALKVGKQSEYNLLIDDITVE